ncbi:MAG TPA: GxxExxY protein [Allosphingosinicella sp.]
MPQASLGPGSPSSVRRPSTSSIAGYRCATFRADLLVEGRLIVEVKAIDRLAAIHSRQVRRDLS